jgi:hypothetical protein
MENIEKKIDLKKLKTSELLELMMDLRAEYSKNIKMYEGSSSSVVINAKEEYIKKYQLKYDPVKEEIDKRIK